MTNKIVYIIIGFLLIIGVIFGILIETNLIKSPEITTEFLFISKLLAIGALIYNGNYYKRKIFYLNVVLLLL